MSQLLVIRCKPGEPEQVLGEYVQDGNNAVCFKRLDGTIGWVRTDIARTARA